MQEEGEMGTRVLSLFLFLRGVEQALCIREIKREPLPCPSRLVFLEKGKEKRSSFQSCPFSIALSDCHARVRALEKICGG